jgi:hypothetical protein
MKPQPIDQRYRRHVRDVILATVFILGLIAALSAADAGQTSVYVAVDPFHGDGETGGFIEHRRDRFQIHVGCFNPCAAGVEYLWPIEPGKIELFFGLAALDGVNHINGTRLNISGGFSWRVQRRISFQYRHYSNGARWDSPISDADAANRGWNFLGLKLEF